jgi:excisionase family DNA binding protein
VAEPLLLRVEEVARALAIGRSKVYELIASGQLPSITIGSARRVPTEALQKWIAEHVDAGAAGTR